MAKMNRRDFLAKTGAVLGLAGYVQAIKAAYRPTNPPKSGPAENPPLPFVPGSWTLVILPDTQLYSIKYPGMLHLQTQWVADNKDKYNIIYVLQNGDITHRNTRLEWERASAGFARLDGHMPYALALGNHDYTPDGARNGRDKTLINNNFPPSRFVKWPTFGGVMEEGRIENNYHLFKAAGQNWLILCLEWGPRDKTLEWASQILQKFPNHKAIIVTHAYLYSDSTRYNWQEKGESQKWNPHSYNTAGGVNDGEQMWQKLVKKHANVFMTINGHVLNDGMGFLVSKGDHGNPVYQMLVNFQMRPIGGESQLRLLKFLPDGKTIHVKTYCPLYEKYETEPESQFVIKLASG